MKSVFFPGKIFLSVFALFLLQGCDIFASSDQKEASFVNRNLRKDSDLRKKSMNFEIARFEKYSSEYETSSAMAMAYIMQGGKDFFKEDADAVISKECQSKFYKRYRFLHYVSSPKILNAPNLDEGIDKLVRNFDVLNTREIKIPIQNLAIPSHYGWYDVECFGTEYLLSGEYVDHDKCSVPSQEFAKKWSDYNINERGYSEGNFPNVRNTRLPIDVYHYVSRKDDFDWVRVGQDKKRLGGHRVNSVHLVPARLLQDEISSQCFLVQSTDESEYTLYSKKDIVSNKSDSLVRKHFLIGKQDYFQNPWEPEDF